MKTFVKFNFWGYLVAGLILIFYGVNFLVQGNETVAVRLMLVGVVQLLIFYGLLFYLYKGKIKDAIK